MLTFKEYKEDRVESILEGLGYAGILGKNDTKFGLKKLDRIARANKGAVYFKKTLKIPGKPIKEGEFYSTSDVRISWTEVFKLTKTKSIIMSKFQYADNSGDEKRDTKCYLHLVEISKFGKKEVSYDNLEEVNLPTDYFSGGNEIMENLNNICKYLDANRLSEPYIPRLESIIKLLLEK